MIFAYRIFMALHGRSNRDNWSNLFFINTDDAIDHNNHRLNIDYLVNALKASAPTEVNFMRAHVKAHAENRYNRPPDAFLSVELQQVGQRNAAGEVLPLYVALVVSRDTTYNRAGRLVFRGFVSSADVDVSERSQYELLDPTIFTGEGMLVDRLNDGPPHGEFVLPNPPGLIVQTPRSVVNHRIAGVMQVDYTRRRKSSQSKEVEAAQSKVNNILNQALRIAAGLAFTAVLGARRQVLLTLAAQARGLLAELPAYVRANLVLPAAFEILLALTD